MIQCLFWLVQYLVIPTGMMKLDEVRVIIIAANRLTTSAKVCVLKVLELNPLGMKTYDNVSFPIVDGMLVHEPTDA